MTRTEAKRKIFTKCRHCRFWSCAVWCNGEPIEDSGLCLNGNVWRDGEEWSCKSFDYADWIVKKTIKESEKESEEEGEAER